MTHCYCNTLIYHILFYNLKLVNININPLMIIATKLTPPNTLVMVVGITWGVIQFHIINGINKIHEILTMKESTTILFGIFPFKPRKNVL